VAIPFTKEEQVIPIRRGAPLLLVAQAAAFFDPAFVQEGPGCWSMTLGNYFILFLSTSTSMGMRLKSGMTADLTYLDGTGRVDNEKRRPSALRQSYLELVGSALQFFVSVIAATKSHCIGRRVSMTLYPVLETVPLGLFGIGQRAVCRFFFVKSPTHCSLLSPYGFDPLVGRS
jgi:hypothetical protein